MKKRIESFMYMLQAFKAIMKARNYAVVTVDEKKPRIMFMAEMPKEWAKPLIEASEDMKIIIEREAREYLISKAG